MTNSAFVKTIQPDLARCFGSGRLNNLFAHISPAGLCPKTTMATPDSIAWLLCALIFCRSTEPAKIAAWAEAKREQWGSDSSSPFGILCGLLALPHTSRLITAIVANRTTGVLTAYAFDGSEISSAEVEQTSFAEVVAVDPVFIAWAADKLYKIRTEALKMRAELN